MNQPTAGQRHSLDSVSFGSSSAPILRSCGCLDHQMHLLATEPELARPLVHQMNASQPDVREASP
jgi:hypothetical protein